MPDAEARPHPHRWQDLLFMFGSAGFSLALVPALVLDTTRFPLWSSVLNFTILILFAATKWTLRLRLAAASEAVTALLWVLVAVYRH